MVFRSTLTAGDVARCHALLGNSEDVVAQRRAVYQVPIELLAEDRTVADVLDVLDHPITRGHLADVLSGSTDYDPGALCALTESAGAVEVAGHPVRVAESPSAPATLLPALRRVAAELARHGADPRPPSVLTADDPGFGLARGRFLDGVRLAVRLMPPLALALLPHVVLVALLRADTARRLGSASAREYPGLVLLPEPASVLEAAEAFVHEGAHVAFFDLAITRSVLGPDQYAAPAFAPSWAAVDQPGWPLEQTFAAYHAYCCLAAFADTLGEDDPEPSESSLLPKAATRAREIGDWLRSQASFLGADGRTLLGALLGVPPAAWQASGKPAVPMESGGEGFVRRVGDRTLVAYRGRPVRMYWLEAHRSAQKDDLSARRPPS
jgi:hypothetical protein